MHWVWAEQPESMPAYGGGSWYPSLRGKGGERKSAVGLGLKLGLELRRVCVGLMMCLGAGDGARTYGGELNTTSIPG